MLLDFYFSSTILLIKVPTPWETNTRNSSPSLRVIRGVDDHPTPAGVLSQTRQITVLTVTKMGTYPVMMIVPAGRVVPWERKETILGTEKIKSLYIQVSSARIQSRTIYSLEAARLDCLPVKRALNLDIGELVGLVLVDEGRTNRASAVERLGITPLRLGELSFSGGNVVGGGKTLQSQPGSYHFLKIAWAHPRT